MKFIVIANMLVKPKENKKVVSKNMKARWKYVQEEKWAIVKTPFTLKAHFFKHNKKLLNLDDV